MDEKNQVVAQPKKENAVTAFVKRNPFPTTLAAAAATGVGAYAALRHPSKSSVIYKAFGKHLEPVIQRAPYGVKRLLPESGAERFAWNQWKQLPTDWNKELKAHPGRIKDKGEFMDAARAKSTHMVDPDKEMYMGMEMSDLKHTPNFKPGTNLALLTTDPTAKKVLDKYEHQRALEHTGFGIKTDLVHEPEKIKNMSNDEIKAHFHKKYGDNWILKPRDDAATHLGGSLGPQTIIHSGTRSNKRWDLVRKHAHEYIRQEKLNIHDEYRATIAGDKVISVVPRWDYGLGWTIPKTKFMHPKLHKDIEAAVKAHHQALGISHKTPMVAGMDFAAVKDANGNISHKIVETNLGINGGELDYPYQNTMLYKHMTGRHTKPVAAAAAATAGIGVGAATAIALKPKKEKTVKPIS